MKVRLFTLIGITLISATLFAQQQTIENVNRRTYFGSDEIENTGFYSVIQKPDQKGKIREYQIRFFDLNLKEGKNVDITLSKSVTISNTAGNDHAIAICFSDLKLKQSKIVSYNHDGEMIGELVLESAIPKSKIYRGQNGFYIVDENRKSKMSMNYKVSVIKTDNELNVIWKKTLDEKLYNIVFDIQEDKVTEDVAIVYTQGKGLSKDKYRQYLWRIDKEGKETYNTQFSNNAFQYPNKIIFEESRTLAFGSYPPEGKSKPVGVFAYVFSEIGEVTEKVHISYKDQISKEIANISSEEDINMKDIPQFIVNDVIKLDDGSFKVVTETIKLRPSIGGSAQVSSGGSTGGSVSTNTALIMGDFLILNLTENLKLEDIQVVTKRKNKVIFEGIVFNVGMVYLRLKEQNASNFQFLKSNVEDELYLVYTSRKNFFNEIKIGVADLNSTDKVIKSLEIDSDIEKLKEVRSLKIMNNKENKITVSLLEKKTVQFYELEF